MEHGNLPYLKKQNKTIKLRNNTFKIKTIKLTHKIEDLAQLVNSLTKSWVGSPSPHKTRHGVNPQTGEVETGGSEVTVFLSYKE